VSTFFDRKNSKAPCRNSIKASAPPRKEPLLLSTPSFWEWVAPSKTITRWSFSRSLVLILKELRSLLQSFMFILSICCQTCPYQTCPFPALLSTLIRRRFQVKSATLLIPIDLFLLPLVEKIVCFYLSCSIRESCHDKSWYQLKRGLQV